MSSEKCFLEAHYYSGGLRHQFYASNGSRPEWAPAADAVGFSDEFELLDGDAAVEVRRFAGNKDNVTWIGVYYRSVDARSGDRGNHAGIGAWFRSQVPADTYGILHGLSLLAKRISQDIEPASIEAHCQKFLSAEFLPAYALSEEQIAPSPGFPFGPAGIVDSKLYFVECAGSISDCRALADFLSNALILETAPLDPRLLFKVGATAPKEGARLEKIEADYDVSAKLVRAIPRYVANEKLRAEKAETDAAESRQRLQAVETELSGLKAESAELIQFRDDPQRVVSRKLADLQADIRDLSLKIDGLGQKPSVSSVWTPPVSQKKPVSSVSAEPQDETEWTIWAWVLLVTVILAVAVGAVLLVEWLVR